MGFMPAPAGIKPNGKKGIKRNKTITPKNLAYRRTLDVPAERLL